jgi:large subunit ribosomal protein L10
MPRPEKVDRVNELARLIGSARFIVLTQFSGLSVPEMNELRRRLREAGAEYHVVKNTLTRIAAEQVGKTELISFLQGPNAIAFGFGDEVALARTLVEYERGARGALKVVAAVMDGRVLGPADLSTLASLPPRTELLARVVGGMQSPLYRLAGALHSLLAGVVWALEARRRQLEQGGGEAVPVGTGT